VFERLDKTTVAVLGVLALVAVLLAAFMVHIVDRSSEHINEIKQTKVDLPTRVAPLMVDEDELTSITLINRPNFVACVVSDAKLTDAILRKVLAIDNLRELCLKRCEFKRSDFQTLSTHPFEILRIEDGTISDDSLGGIARMPTVRHFGMIACDIEPSALRQLAGSNIRWLEIRSSKSIKNDGKFIAADLVPLCDLNHLSFLDVERTRFASGAFRGLAGSTAFCINVERCDLSDDDLRDIAKMPHIEYVKAIRNPNLTCKSARSLLEAKSFRSGAMDLETISKCGFTDQEMNKLDPEHYLIRKAFW